MTAPAQDTILDATLSALESLDLRALRAEVNKLRAIKQWALSTLGVDYQTGDRVTITSEEPSGVGGGWAHYSEALAPGQSGIAGEISFNTCSNRWQVLVGLDRSWSTHKHNDFTSRVDRYWNGPVEETPEGYTPPSKHTQEMYPGGKVKHFYLDVGWVVKAENYVPEVES